MAISAQYPGVYAAMATPIARDGEVDPTGIKNVVDYLFDNGVTGLSILGSTGEGPALTIAQRRHALEATMEATDGRGAVFTGAASSVVSEVIESLKTVAGSGAEGALVPPPFYYRLGTDGIIGYYERIAEASPVPIIIYNIPSMTKLQIPPEAVARLIEHPNIMGLKDSGGDFGYFSTLARIAHGSTGFTLYTGSDAMLASSLWAGGHGLNWRRGERRARRAGRSLSGVPGGGCRAGPRLAGRGCTGGRRDAGRHLPRAHEGAVRPEGIVRAVHGGADPAAHRCRDGAIAREADRRGRPAQPRGGGGLTERAQRAAR